MTPAPDTPLPQAEIDRLAAELSDDDIRALTRTRGWRTFAVHTKQAPTRMIEVDATGHPLRIAAEVIADKRGHQRLSDRWWEVYDIALRLLREAEIMGQRHAYNDVLERMAGWIEPDATESDRGRGKLELAETMQTYIDKRRPNLEALDREPVDL